MSSLKRRVTLFLAIFLCSSGLLAIAGNLEKGITLYDTKKFNEAFPLIEKEARQGNAKAEFYLAMMYDYGNGTKQNTKKAVYWYKKSAAQGNPKAMYNLAYMYSHGTGVETDSKKAFELYQQSAEKGIPEAQFNLALMYAKGKGTGQDYVKAFQWFHKAALQGNDDAQYNVAVSYTEGRGIPQDYTQALYWYEKAAAQDNTLAQHALGIVYRNGEGVPVDIDKAVYWYKKAAAKGYTDSMWNLSTIYLPQDIHDIKGWEEVHHWYTLGMQHGDKTNAPLGMGLIYLLGRGNYTVDSDKAGALFTMAAENGNANAWYWLGVMEEYGFGRPQNEEKAMALYRKAADAGVEPAINRLEHGHRDWSMKLFKALRPLFGP